MNDFDAMIDSMKCLLKEESDIIKSELDEYGEYSCDFGCAGYSAMIKLSKE